MLGAMGETSETGVVRGACVRGGAQWQEKGGEYAVSHHQVPTYCYTERPLTCTLGSRTSLPGIKTTTPSRHPCMTPEYESASLFQKLNVGYDTSSVCPVVRSSVKFVRQTFCALGGQATRVWSLFSHPVVRTPCCADCSARIAAHMRNSDTAYRKTSTPLTPIV